MHHAPHRHLLQIDPEIGPLGLLVRIVHAREALDLPPPRFGIDAALIRLLAVLKTGRDVDEVEAPIGGDGLARALPTRFKGRNGRGDDGRPGFRQLARYKGYALDVLVAVFLGETEFGRELAAHRVPEQEADGPPALLMQRHVEGARHRVLAAVLVAGQEDGEALFEARGMALAQHFDDFRVGEPLGDVLARAQARSQLRAGDVEGAYTLLNFVVRLVLVRVWEVGHHLEGHDFDTQLVLVLFDGVLCIVWSVEVLAGAVLAGPGVVAPNDEVRGSVVFADNGVPDSFSGPTHAHSEREETQYRHSVGVAGEKGLVDAYAGKVVNVSGLSEAYNGVDQDVRLTGAGSADGELAVGAVHGVAGLESDDSSPTKF